MVDQYSHDKCNTRVAPWSIVNGNEYNKSNKLTPHKRARMPTLVHGDHRSRCSKDGMKKNHVIYDDRW